DRRLSGGTFGAGGGGSPSVSTNRRFQLTISMSVRQLLDHTNTRPIVGDITSPLFCPANQPAGVRHRYGFSRTCPNRPLACQQPPAGVTDPTDVLGLSVLLPCFS